MTLGEFGILMLTAWIFGFVCGGFFVANRLPKHLTAKNVPNFLDRDDGSTE